MNVIKMSITLQLMFAAFLLIMVEGKPHEPLTMKECGYASCHPTEADKLNIHIVAHTHDDVGWLKTVDQYYYGSKSYIQKAGVQYILDSVIKELLVNPDRRFIYVETAFFHKWWVKQSPGLQSKVRMLIEEGRLEFISGAWSMNDEATVHYQSTIDQFTWGLRVLNETFGKCSRPRIGWQIDPFGHSREFASMLALMGYDGLFNGRLDYQDKRQRLEKKSMEMIWRGNDDLGVQSDIFTGMLYNTYSPPPGFCFDILCSDDPLIDDVKSPDYNIKTKIETMLAYISRQMTAYGTANVMLTMGGDFTYMNADNWYINLDKLIRHGNEYAKQNNIRAKFLYSTPSCYLKAVHEANPKLPTKADDFFPYASDSHAYWTGYFTSRPTIKYFERVGNSFAQVIKQLELTAVLKGMTEIVNNMKSAMGIMQHHDAVTGTERQHVADDYSRILNEAIEDGMHIVRKGVSKLAVHNGTAVTMNLTRCQFNVSECLVAEDSENLLVTVYNALGWSVVTTVKIPVKREFDVYDDKGKQVEVQLIDISADVREIPLRRSDATHEVAFRASVPPVGFRNYFMKIKSDSFLTHDMTVDLSKLSDNFLLDGAPVKSSEVKRHVKRSVAEFTNVQMELPDDFHPVHDIPIAEHDHGGVKVSLQLEGEEDRLMTFAEAIGREINERMLGDQADDVETITSYTEDSFIENENIKILLDSALGKTTNLILKEDGTNISFDVAFMYYPGYVGDNSVAANRSSGAYIFRPNSTSALTVENLPEIRIIKGPLVEEVHFRYNEFISSIMRLNKNDTFVEYEWLVGPIPVDDGVGKEIILRYNTNLSNNDVFYTDANGRSTLKRTLNHRPQYDLKLYEPIAGNYYPVTSRIFIEDEEAKLRFSVLNDRAQGGSSLNEGQIELMVHRRLLHDDAFGVSEALNETYKNGIGLVARGKHYIHLAKTKNEFTSEKIKTVKILNEPNVFVANAESVSLDDFMSYDNVFSAIKMDLPECIHLLSFEKWNDNMLLLRLENVLESTDGNAEEVKIKLSDIFKFKIKKVDEMMLGANLLKSEHVKLDWRTNGELADVSGEPRLYSEADDFVVGLKPMEIITLMIHY